MKIRPGQLTDIDDILARLSDQHRAEFAKVGFPGDLFQLRMMRFLAAGDTAVLEFDGAPQALLSIGPGGNGTWLMVTREFFDKGLASIRAARRHMTEKAQTYGTIVAYVGSEHPQAIRWMEAIGFTYVGAVDGLKIFLYR